MNLVCSQRTSQNLGAGYNAPECTKPSAYTLKSDIYSFGVVMLELLTGRMPLDRCLHYILYFLLSMVVKQSVQYFHIWDTSKALLSSSSLSSVQSQNQSNVSFVGLPRSFMTSMRWRKWWTLPCGDFTLLNHSSDLLTSSPFVFRWVMNDWTVHVLLCMHISKSVLLLHLHLNSLYYLIKITL